GRGIFCQKTKKLGCSPAGVSPPTLQGILLYFAFSLLPARTWTCCPVSWKRFQANCYYSASDSMSWDESEKNCTGMGSHLVVINTQAEQDFLLRWTKDIYSDRRGYFIGLSAQEVEAQWRWVDQTPYNQTAAFWRPGEPSSPETEKCTAFQVNSRVEPKQNWNDVSCSIPLNRICEAAAAFM
uniref:C-type lectin domain family 4 member D n=1 Tax=Crocodylus porosus TaxID=8502 RepID=A0A7M4F5F6_CROPO